MSQAPLREVDQRTEEATVSMVFHVARELRTALDRKCDEHGVTSQQAALLLLSRLQRASPNKMAERLGTDTAGMTRLLDRLESKGFIARKTSPEDRRSIVVVLGPRSKRILPRLIPEFRRAEKGLLVGFEEREVDELNVMLRRLLEDARNLDR